MHENSAMQSIGPRVTASPIAASPIAMSSGTPVIDSVAQPQITTPIEHWPTLRRGCIALAITAIGDECLYRSGGGFAGWSVFVLAAVALLTIGIGKYSFTRPATLIAIGVVLCVSRLVWEGNVPTLLFACCCLILFSMTLQSYSLNLNRAAAFTATLIPNSVLQLPRLAIACAQSLSRFGGTLWLTIGIPFGVCLAFIFLFIMANPDFSDLCKVWIDQITSWTRERLDSLQFTELLFWAFVGTISFGLVIPNVAANIALKDRAASDHSEITSIRYQIGRNTLISVNVLFVVYLVVEFSKSWGRVFPPGFHFSGFAHQGAAWLTVALALTTFVLGVIFTSSLQLSERVIKLRWLAVTWVALNWLLAFAAYHRLFVYVQYNGLTRMRIVGFLGITCVMIGLIWAIRKIDHQRTFRWMLGRQFCTMLLFIFLYCVAPVDLIAYQYNVGRIINGHPEPLVQVTEQRLSNESWVCIAKLIDSGDPKVRDGILAMLADRLLRHPVEQDDWRHFQGSLYVLQAVQSAHQNSLQPFFDDRQLRESKIQAIRDHAYQWY